MIASHLARPLRLYVAIALGAALLAVPRIASAQPYSWQIPAGGETWTAGTTHTVEWSGGPVGVNVNVFLISITPYQVYGPVVLNSAYLLPVKWPIPANLPPGQYQLNVMDVSTTTYQYSNIFTVQAPPACSQGCTLVAVAPEDLGGYPATHCGTTAAIALAYAQSWINGRLYTECNGTIDNSSVMADYTFLPVGACYAGEFGPYQVEVSAVACCCTATGVRRSSWGTLKVHYR